jgi:Subtilase family
MCVQVDGCAPPVSGFPLVIGVTRGQGLALRAQLTAGQNVTVSMQAPPNAPQQPRIGLGIFSGTSMATPLCAGLAGMLWAAHTECSAAEVHAALRATAKLPAGSPAGVNRTNSAGYGIVQARAAHEYLLANPCMTRSMRASLIFGPSNKGPFAAGSVLSVSVFVREAGVPSVPLAGLAVQLVPGPGASGGGAPLVQCERTALRTGVVGRASTRCTLSAQAGRTSLTAVVSGLPGMAGVNVTRVMVIQRV